MLLYLTNYLAQFESGFNVFNYLTMRAILGALTALVLSFVVGPRMIARLSMNQVGQPIRELGPSTHLPKAGTPTMGGALILTAIVVGIATTALGLALTIRLKEAYGTIDEDEIQAMDNQAMDNQDKESQSC